YYTDEGFTPGTEITVSNYTVGPFFCDFDADGYRLATEGEWEYFCRAGTTGPFSCNEMNYTSGNCTSCGSGTHPVLEQYCVYCANNPGATAPVGNKFSNPWNLKDVHGNVWEWCWDQYGTYPAGPETDYEGPDSGSGCVFRGGCWYYWAQNCRSAQRLGNLPGFWFFDLGFRLVRTIN
ncbi:formylglycine-generating enzyme family protein, partial [bacterium]|nr:formylglycine-generating enzyme family protein [candidate division CSSED10-310 bacterium]